jgi:hypothetical protein
LETRAGIGDVTGLTTGDGEGDGGREKDGNGTGEVRCDVGEVAKGLPTSCGDITGELS